MKEYVVERENMFLEYVKNWNNQNIILFGAGEAARRIYMFLRENNLQDHVDICVQSDYVEKASRASWLVDGISVNSFEEIIGTGKKYDVIMGFAGWDIEFFKKYNNIDQIYNLDVFSGIVLNGYLTNIPYAFYENNADRIDNVYYKLQDDLSRRCYSGYINQRISGKYSYSDNMVHDNQYFDAIIDYTKIGTFVDVGAFDGKDTLNYFERCGESGKSILLEPDLDNQMRIKHNLDAFNGRYKLIGKGAWDQEKELSFKAEGNMQSGISEDGNVIIRVDSLDHLLAAEKRIDLIKMDIEGSELIALHGAKSIIKAFHPALCICIYHKPEDLFTIPEFILSVDPSYKLYVRRYSTQCCETVLYAV